MKNFWNVNCVVVKLITVAVCGLVFACLIGLISSQHNNILDINISGVHGFVSFKVKEMFLTFISFL